MNLTFEEIMEIKNDLLAMYPLKKGEYHVFPSKKREIQGYTSFKTLQGLRAHRVKGHYIDSTGWVYQISPDDDSEEIDLKSFELSFEIF
jgi:hypothetical protein